MLTKHTMGTPSLQVLPIGVTGSSKIRIKTEVSSPEQKVHVNVKVV